MDKKIRYFTLPNIFTLLNLTFGTAAIFFAFQNFEQNLVYAALFVLAAMVFDFLDGFIARLTNSVSEFGKQLDSFADIISFAVAPAAIAFQMLKMALEVKVFSFDLQFTEVLVLLSPILLVISAALRLSRFNLSDNNSKGFFGMPVPMTALFFIALPLVDSFTPDRLLIGKGMFDIVPFKIVMATIGIQAYLFMNIWFYIGSIIVFSILQIVNVPMLSLKGKKIGNYKTYLLIPISLTILAVIFFKKTVFGIIKFGGFEMMPEKRFDKIFNELPIDQRIVWAVVILVALVSIFYLVFEFIIPLIKLLISKNKSEMKFFNWLKESTALFIFIAISVLLFLYLENLSIPIIVILYILISLGDDFVNLFKKK